MGNVYTVNEILVGALSDRPAPDRNIILYVDKDTGNGSLSDGTRWNDFGWLRGVTSDNMGGVLAQNFTAYPTLADPTEGATITAIPWTDDGDAPLPAGSYEYQIAYGDINGNLTAFFGSGAITLDGTQLPKLESPASRPADALSMAFLRLVGGTTFYRVPAVADATVPFVDFHTDDELIASAAAWPIPNYNYNQTYPTATFGPTTIQGSVVARAAIAEWSATPQATQPSLVASRADTQAQIDELVTVLVAKGTVADNRTA